MIKQTPSYSRIAEGTATSGRTNSFSSYCSESSRYGSGSAEIGYIKNFSDRTAQVGCYEERVHNTYRRTTQRKYDCSSPGRPHENGSLQDMLLNLYLHSSSESKRNLQFNQAPTHVICKQCGRWKAANTLCPRCLA